MFIIDFNQAEILVDYNWIFFWLQHCSLYIYSRLFIISKEAIYFFMRGLYFQIILSMHSSIIKFYHVFLRLFPSKFYLFRVKKLFNLSFFIFFIKSDHITASILFFEMNILLIQAKWTLFPSLYRYFNFISQRCVYKVQILQPSSPSFSLIFPSALLPTMSSQPDIHSGTPTLKKAQFYHL